MSFGNVKRRYAVTRKDLAVLVSTETGYALKDVRKIISSLFNMLPKLIVRGHRVRITGFGVFGTKIRKGRKYSGLVNQPEEWISEDSRIPDMKPTRSFYKKVRAAKIFQ